MKLIQVVATLLLTSGCSLAWPSSAVVPSYSPRRLVFWALPDDLRASSDPEVLLLVRRASDPEIEAAHAEMVRRGFVLVGERGAGWDGVEQRFFGGMMKVLQGAQSSEQCWIASEILWMEGLPYEWGQSPNYAELNLRQGSYLVVPAAHGGRARDLLMADDRIRGLVIDHDGALIPDLMIR